MFLRLALQVGVGIDEEAYTFFEGHLQLKSATVPPEFP
jgi:hypothetical protein